MANQIGFKLVKDDKLKNVLLFIFFGSLILVMLGFLVTFITKIPKLFEDVIFLLTFSSIIICSISYIIYTYINLLKMHGTIFLQANSVRILVEKEQYAFSLFDPIVISEYNLPIENIIKIEILYLGFESLTAKAGGYEKRDGHKNTIYIQTKENEYEYIFFSDEKRDKKHIATYVIFWKRNYNVEIKWGSQVIEEKDLDRLEEYAYS